MQKTQFESHIICKPSQIKYPTKNSFPRARDKHAACVHENYVYVIAGKDGNTSLKDFWRFHSGTLKWEALSYRGDTPSHLEGHSLVSFKKLLLLFGGEFGDSLTASSLWVINPDLGYVRTITHDPGSERPCVRRHHSAVVYNGAMYVYGGYVDIKGSSSELWCYQIEDEEWELVITRQSQCDVPGGRYGHSAVVYTDHMWLYGGMTDLVPKQDLWAYSFGAQRWERIKNKYCPPQLTGHSAAVVGSSMILFGGTTNREPVNQLWCFCFKTLKWTEIILEEHDLSPLSFHTAVTVTPSAQDSTVKACSMPYLQKKISQLNLNKPQPRPKSSPGQRSQPTSNLPESESLRRTPFERSISAQVFGLKGCDPNDPIIPKWDNLQNHKPQVLDLRNEGSSESLKLYPAPAENAMDISPLIPERTDFNFNTAELFDRNVVSRGIDNLGISNSTEELINESRRKRYEIFEANCDTDFNNHAVHIPMESINSDYVAADSLVIESHKLRGAKKTRLDPELVLEDLEYSDSLVHHVKISYPKKNSISKGFSSSESLPESEEMETIELDDVRVRNRSRSESAVPFNNYVNSNTDSQSRDSEFHQGSVVESSSQYGVMCDSIQKERRLQSMNNRTGVNMPQSVETSLHQGLPIEELNRRNRLYSKKEQKQRKSTSAEPPYMLVLGGKDKQKANFSVRPIPLWKFVFNTT